MSNKNNKNKPIISLVIPVLDEAERAVVALLALHGSRGVLYAEARSIRFGVDGLGHVVD